MIVERLTDERLQELLEYGDWEPYDPPVDARELYAIVLELMRFRTLPQHARGCSNQNVINPIGAYVGVHECGCRR